MATIKQYIINYNAIFRIYDSEHIVELSKELELSDISVKSSQYSINAQIVKKLDIDPVTGDDSCRFEHELSYVAIFESDSIGDIFEISKELETSEISTSCVEFSLHIEVAKTFDDDLE